MPLARLYAYAVPPNKNVDPLEEVPGGALADFRTLGAVIERTTAEVRAADWINVILNVDASSTDRASDVRSALLAVAFDAAPAARGAAQALAERLAGVMDKRSGEGCLMVISVRRNQGSRSVTLWTFPRDEALQFTTGSNGPTVALLEDAFSRRSRLHKAFTIAGPDTGPTSFLTGTAVDLVTGGAGEAANYWIQDFLDAELSVGGEEGSRMLARALRAAWDSTEDRAQREQFHDAAIAIRTSRRRRWSVRAFADEFLGDAAKATFLKTSEARKMRSEQFGFDREAFDRIIRWRVFDLDNGIKVSAPFADADRLLEFEQTQAGRRLTASGVIREEKVSQRA